MVVSLMALTRRAVFWGGGSAFLPTRARASVDPYAHWSFFGMAPPPIQRTVTYDELLHIIQRDRIRTVQIAVQHDCVIATTKTGHRLALMLRDRDVPLLLVDTLEREHIPYTYLPIDVTKQYIRSTAEAAVVGYGAFLLADLAGWVPWDTTPYNSLAEREKTIEEGRQRKSLRDRLRNETTTGD